MTIGLCKNLKSQKFINGRNNLFSYQFTTQFTLSKLSNLDVKLGDPYKRLQQFNLLLKLSVYMQFVELNFDKIKKIFKKNPVTLAQHEKEKIFHENNDTKG